ncbi:MAG: UDP-glucose 4-epimerase GalE [Rickettsiales bacterium]|jgi:UDP-glucose 4-epimerase|nr:UDP-glucose 4-epimerase GalE [Rickettsiales bacterium]
MKTILLTGGAGFIGSHVAVELLQQGYNVVIVDNLRNAEESVIGRIERIANKKPIFYKIDCLDKKEFKKVFEKQKIEGVIHFAGLKAVGESCENPLLYYKTNFDTTINLLEIMQEFNVKNLVFSSSCTVYGIPKEVPVDENTELQKANSPYGHTKLVQEELFQNLYKSDNSWNISLLRYFNPVGAHPSGLLGETQKELRNLMPYIVKVAKGEIKELAIFGNDYETYDGTCIRDYVHVVDLAKGHIKALENGSGILIANLGNGKGYSVLELVNTFARVCVPIAYSFKPKRAGDVPVIYADVKFAKEKLGWVAEKTLEDMCRDAWNYEKTKKD